jgi:hypothetical protein
MDLVYRHSGHPVALLARPIKFVDELGLLAKILTEELVGESSEAGGSRFSTTTNRLEDTER